MKKYRLDEDPRNPVPIIPEEEDLEERGDTKRIWVEEIIKIFGETHYTENYRLFSRRKIKKLGLTY